MLRLVTRLPLLRILRGVLLRLLIEFALTLIRAEIVSGPLILGLSSAFLIIYLHSTNRISLHGHGFSPLISPVKFLAYWEQLSDGLFLFP